MTRGAALLRLVALVAAVWGGLGASLGLAAPAHGISMQGQPELPPDFVSLPYAWPDAPKGGTLVSGEIGGFDSLNPFILKGRAPAALQTLVFETLMARNWDEPFSLYGLLAESIDTDDARSWVEFVLRPEARFSDGSPVTVEDVMWSMQTLAEKGLPRYRVAWDRVARMTQTGPRSVRFDFTAPDRELPLLIGLRPILRKADWEGQDFAASTLRVPIGSGPYVVGAFEPGRSIDLVRNPDWWGRDLPINRGLQNFDRIRTEYFVDSGVLFQSFTAGELSFYRELNPSRWARDYGFPLVTSGAIVKEEIPHGRPSGMEGFVFNTRRPLFADWRVRDALLHAFDFEFVNRAVTQGQQPRRTSYFSNSELAMGAGPADPGVRALLEPYRDSLVPGALEAYALPSSDGSPRNRANLLKALKLLEAAGWKAESGRMVGPDGQPFRFEILLQSGQSEVPAMIFADALRQIGIEAHITVVDQAQYNERRTGYEFDMIVNAWNMSLSPGNEQALYWGRSGVTTPGSRNYAGIDSPAVEAMIGKILEATDRAAFVTAVRALDRVLTTGRYVIPFAFADRAMIAHKANLKHPDVVPVYGDWISWLPEVWWQQD